jgi:hypothetical protein
MRDAARRCRESGLLIGLTGFHQMYADACRAAGRAQEALQSVEEGLALAEASGERSLVPAMRRVRGELLLERGDAAAAEADLTAAIALAGEREAFQHELEARVAWCALPHVDAAAARAALAQALARYGDEKGPAATAARLWLEAHPAPLSP